MQQSSTTWEVVAAGELSRRKLRGSSPALHEVVIPLLVADIIQPTATAARNVSQLATTTT
jgi:hypothetical protein